MPATMPRLRPATGSDVEFLADVVLRAVEDRQRRRPGWDRAAFHRGLVEDALDQVAGGPEHSVTYVISVGSVDVGRARLVVTADQMEIAGLQILPRYQGRGTGSAVLSRLIDQAEAAGMAVVLDVETDNPRARRLYERLEFQPVGPVSKGRQTMIHRARAATAPWGSETWRADAERWSREEMSALGREPVGPMRAVSTHAWSAVWRIASDAGDVLVKQGTAARRREGEVVAFCARAAPEHVDPPLASDPASGRILLEDQGPTLYMANPDTRGVDLDSVVALVSDYARLQQATVGQEDSAVAAGLPRWDPGLAAHEADQQAAWMRQLPDGDPRRITAAQADRIRACRADVDGAARRLAASPVPACVEHGDLWPGNVLPAHGQGRYRFIDFGDAAWTHPFLSMGMMVVECRHRWSVPDRSDGLNLDHPALRQILDAYLAAWTAYAPMDRLRAILRDALRIAPLRRSRAWILNLAHADPEELRALGHLPGAWLDDLAQPILD